MDFIIRIICVSIIILICLPTSDVMKEYPTYCRTLGFIFLFLMFITKILLNNLSLKYILNITIPWIGVILFCFVPSAIANVSLEVFTFPITIAVLYFIVIPNTPLRPIDLALASSLLNIYISYRCFYEMDIWYSVFQGTATNSNQFALIIFGGIVGSFYLFLIKKNILWKLYSLTILIITIALVAFSSSRTVMITSVIMVIYTLILYFYKRQMKINKTFFVFLILFFLFYLIINYYDVINNFFFNKWSDSSSNITSGRINIWLQSIKEASLGGNFYSNVNANSEYFNYLILYGVIPFIAYIIFCVISLKKIVKIYKKNKSSDDYFYLCVIVSFLFLSLFENFYSAFGQTINIMFWYSISYIFKGKFILSKHHKIISHEKNM